MVRWRSLSALPPSGRGWRPSGQSPPTRSRARRQIQIQHGSTTLVQEGFGSFHSRSTVMGGSAILLAAGALLDGIRGNAAARLGCGPAEVRIADGYVEYGSVKLPLSEFAGLAVERPYHNKKHTYSYGSHAAHVAVDPATGEVEILIM